MITWPIKITENKYSRWYEQFMFNCQKRSTIEGYTEKHHIIPRSLGGTEDKENLVLLTAKEHYIAHALLWKMSMEPKFHNKMSMALHLMVNGSGTKKQHRNYRISARLYQSIRLAKVEAMKSYIAEHGAVWQGRKHKPESIQKIIDANARTKDLRSAKLSGENNGMFGKKHTKDTLLKMSKSNSAAWTDERKQQYSDTVKKLWADLEFKKQMSEIKKNSAGWQNRDWKNIGRKAADARMAKGWKPTEEFKKKISETRRAKMASGEIPS